MNTLDLERLCDEALQRLAHFINRSAGQHIRAMRHGQAMTRDQLIANALYCGYMADELTESDVRRACAAFGITYPPELTRDEHEHATLGGGVHHRSVSREANHGQAIQREQPEAILAD